MPGPMATKSSRDVSLAASASVMTTMRASRSRVLRHVSASSTRVLKTSFEIPARCCTLLRRRIEIGDTKVDVLRDQVRQLSEDGRRVEMWQVANEDSRLPLGLPEGFAEQFGDEGALVECGGGRLGSCHPRTSSVVTTVLPSAYDFAKPMSTMRSRKAMRLARRSPSLTDTERPNSPPGRRSLRRITSKSRGAPHHDPERGPQNLEEVVEVDGIARRHSRSDENLCELRIDAVALVLLAAPASVVVREEVAAAPAESEQGIPGKTLDPFWADAAVSHLPERLGQGVQRLGARRLGLVLLLERGRSPCRRAGGRGTCPASCHTHRRGARRIRVSTSCSMDRKPFCNVAAEASRSDRRLPSKRSRRIGGRCPVSTTIAVAANHVDVEDEVTEEHETSQGRELGTEGLLVRRRAGHSEPAIHAALPDSEFALLVGGQQGGRPVGPDLGTRTHRRFLLVAEAEHRPADHGPRVGVGLQQLLHQVRCGLGLGRGTGREQRRQEVARSVVGDVAR